jgi:aryl-alcohol dehydrogenase-like predicted oxidoreductase
MEYRSLGRTGVQVSALCLGAMNMGGRSSEEESAAIIDRALAAGLNFIDTANVYGHNPANFEEGRGRSEEIIGQVLAREGKRHNVILATKGHFSMSDDPNARGNSRRHLIEQCEASLKRLQTDWIDLYQLHHPSNEVPIDETLRALDDLIRAGKIRYIGTSVFGAWQIMESLWVAKEYGLNRFTSEQPPYNLLDRRIERELIPMALTYGIAVLPYSPLGAGFLTGKYRADQPVPEGSRFDVFWKGSEKDHFTDAAFRILDTVTQLAAEKGCTPGQIALAWSAGQPGITSPIIGPRTVAQLEENLGALAITLTDEDRRRIDEAAPPGRATVPYYGSDGLAWTTFGPHPHRW